MTQYIIKTIYNSPYYSPSVKVIFSFLDQRQSTSSSNYFSFNTFNNKTNNSQANSQYQPEFKPNASYPKFINTKNMKFPPL